MLSLKLLKLSECSDPYPRKMVLTNCQKSFGNLMQRQIRSILEITFCVTYSVVG